MRKMYMKTVLLSKKKIKLYSPGECVDFGAILKNQNPHVCCGKEKLNTIFIL